MAGMWTTAEVAVLREQYGVHGYNWSGWRKLLPRRSKESVRRKAMAMCIAPPEKLPPGERDPNEFQVADLMERGLTPSQIDARNKWWPGTTRRILKEKWKREWTQSN